MSVKSAIDKHGITLTLRVKSNQGTYNPSTGGITGALTQDYSVKVYPYNYDLMEVDGTSIVKGDRKFLMYPQTAVPQPLTDDEFIGAGDSVKVVSVRKIYSGGRVVAYIVQVRE